MPNLLKKKKGNSRISRLFSDLQTPPKRGGSLVVETGFPTSIIDLFVKNRDRLKKKKQAPKTIEEVCLGGDLELEVKDNDGFVELGDGVEGSDGNLRLGRGSFGNKVRKDENGCVGLGKEVEGSDGNGCLGRGSFGNKVKKNEDGCVDLGYKVEVSDANAVLVRGSFGNKLKKNENGCVEVGNKVEGGDGNERLSRGIFGNKVICVCGLMGLCVLYSKWFVLGLSIGALLLYLFEFVGKLNLIKFRWVFDGVIKGYGVQLEHVNEIDCDGKGEIEEVIELNDGCEMVKHSNFDGFGECGDVLEGGNEGKCGKMVDESGKTKKCKKFWKRCVFKGMNKRTKHRKEGRSCEHESLALTTCSVSSSIGELDDSDESSLSSMVEKGVEQRGEEFVCSLEKHGSGGIGKRWLHRQNMRARSCRMVVDRGLNVECLVVMAIVLVGLINSRMLSLVLTLSCCVGFKLMRRSHQIKRLSHKWG